MGGHLKLRRMKKSLRTTSTLMFRLMSMHSLTERNCLKNSRKMQQSLKAVKSKTCEELTRITEEQQIAIAEFEINEYKDTLSEKVDQYLDYVVEEWMKENELAIERGLKGEIIEDFISGLKQLFEDHYIDVPDEKYDVLEAQSEKIELEEQLNSIMEQNIEMKTANSELVREQVILESLSDLSDTQFEKFKSLTEEIDFSDQDTFREVGHSKESYFPKVNSSETYDNDDDNYGTLNRTLIRLTQ